MAVESRPATADKGDSPTLLWKCGQVLCRVYTTLAFELKVYGVHHVPRTGGVLVVSNHQSYLDPVLLGVQLRRPMSYMARATLFRNRFFNWLITNLNAFPVRRGEGDIGAVKETIRRLHEGRVLAMFPEGTRSTTGEIKSLESGVALLIRRANVPVIPAVIDGSFAAWSKGMKLPRPHPIRLIFGPPLALQGLRANEILPVIESTLKEMLADLRAGNLGKYK